MIVRVGGLSTMSGCTVLDTVVISGEDIGCIVVFGTLVGGFMFSVTCSELLMTRWWSSVYECQRVECAFISLMMTECGMFVMCCMQCCMSITAVL